MVKLKIARVAAAAAASAGLIASFSGVAGATSLNGNLDGNNCGCLTQLIDHHHHHHNNPVKVITDTTTDQTNNVTVDNSTDQNAYTGNVNVNGGGGAPVWSDSVLGNNHHNRGNSTVNATSGDAMNSNSFNANVNANNTAPDVPSPWVPSSHNGSTFVKTETTTDQTNNITVDNQTTQNAYTGNVTVNGGSGKGNSTVNATSGDASNYNSTSVTVNATNK